jgi:hypothetical protein
LRYWIVGGLFVAALVLLGNALMAWRVNAGFANRVAAIRAAGDPASIAELKPPRVPDAENAAVVLDRMRPRLKAFDADYRALLQTPAFIAEIEEFRPGQSMSGEQSAAVERLLASHGDIEERIAQAAACDEYASTADFSFSFQKFVEGQISVQDVRALARLAALRMRLLVDAGRRDEVIARGLELLRLSRLYENEPGLSCFLVSIAVRSVAIRGIAAALYVGPASAESHAALDEELARHDDLAKIQRAVRLERALSVSASMEQMEQATSALPGVLAWAVQRKYAGPLEFYEALLPTLDKPWHKLFAVRRSVFADPGKYGPLAADLAPMIRVTVESGNRDVALVRSMRVLNALVRFAAKNGAEAAGLDDVELPAGAAIDPFSGTPLVVKIADGGWVVYSVDRNGKDDGGVLDPFKDAGLGPDE